MSRVERKKLEKEMKKSKKVFKFKKDGSAPKKPLIDKSCKTGQGQNTNIDINIENKKPSNQDKLRQDLADRPENVKDILDKSLKTGIGNPNKVMVNSSSARTITADKIVSVEDERMYFERKQKQKSIGIDDSSFMTVDDIITLEDEESGIIPNSNLDTKTQESQEDNINAIKKIHIEKAPFEDVVKVAESRKQAKADSDIKDKKLGSEKQDSKLESDLPYKAEDNNHKKDLYDKDGDIVAMEYNKKDETSKLLDSVDSVNKATIDDLYEDAEKKKKPKKTDNKEFKKEENKEPIKEKIDKKSNSNKKVKEGNSIMNSESKSTGIIATENSKRGGGFNKFLFGLLGLILVVYGVGCFIFNGRYFPNTKINGIDAGLKTPSSVEDIASKNAESYSIDITGRKNVKDSIKGSDIGLEFVKDDSASKIKKDQGSLAWPLAFFTDYKYDGKLNIKYDKDKLDSKLADLHINDKKNIVAPKSAVPKYDESKKEVTIDKGELGSTPIKSKLVKFLDQSILAQKTKASYPDSVYKAQKYNADSTKVKKAVATIKPYADTKIVYDFEYEKHQIPGQDIVSMFDLDEEGEYNVKLSRDKVREVVRGLSRKYSTYGDTREIQSASTGGKLKVSGGIYGWLINREKETDELYKIIEKKENVNNRKPIYSQTAVSRQKNDMGDEFIEIDLSKQHMWYVKGGEVQVSTPIVSGNPYNGDATPTGIYPLNYKTRNAVLRGPGYASPVAYWMPFNGNIGIHDSSWQAAYGGSRYLYAGSHGCINTPYSKVAQIYNLAKEGMPVVVHD
ncbi:L,D-transpeptidase family protein [Peptostreptococcus anaerobius]|uniref:L,D-transpeptidase family protein n=1 Tax=Peptostreptococcus anaerobius TaxID=1261 RepID=UPI003D6ED9C2